MDSGAWKPLLLDLLRPRAGAAQAWLSEACSRLAGGARAPLLDAYTFASRRLGQRALELTPAEQAAIAAIDPEAVLVTWTLTDLGRALLLLEAHAVAASEAESTELILAAYEEGDSREQQSWLKSLPLLANAERFLASAIDACRTNILPQFEAIACENPYPARSFPDRNFNQMVLKALFNAIALERIVGLQRRFNAELSRMADDYVSEREAAGRTVPVDIWVVIGPYATATSVDRMRRYLRHGDPAHQHWAQIGLDLAGGAAPHSQRT